MNFNYEHGANIYEYDDYNNLIDYSSNTNPLGLPEHLKIKLDIYQEKYTRYPDPLNSELVESLGMYENMNKEYFYIGNGASDIIFRVVTALKPTKTLLVAPTFSEYEKACMLVNSKIEYYNLSDNSEFELQDDYLDYLTNDLDLVILCNPNNPTGNLIEKNLMKKIISKCYENNIYIMIDECFIDFVENNETITTKRYIEEYPNLIVLKAFTKTFAMAGFRLGYCLLNNEELKKELFISGPDWPISTIAQEIGVKVLEESDYLKQTLQLLNKERDYLTNQLEQLNIKAYKGNANYIFFKYNEDIDLKDELVKKGFLIRSCANYRELDSKYYRICIMKHDINKELIRVLSEVINNG